MSDDLSLILSEVEAGQGIRLNEAAAMFPPVRGAARTHRSTVLGFLKNGCRALDGTTVFLEAVRGGSNWLTTRPAVLRFISRLSAPPAAGPATPPAPTPAARRRAAADADEQLRRAGA